MNTEDMIRELRNLEEKHKNDIVYTGETNWSHLCRDVADRLEEMSYLLQKTIFDINNISKFLKSKGYIL
jgi:hypothetical protein